MRRGDIVRQARKYMDAPFQHQGRSRTLGIDCVGLVLCVAEDLGLVDRFGELIHRGMYDGYGPQPLGNFVQDMCRKHLDGKPFAEMQAGDVVTIAIPSAPCHVAIIGYGWEGRATMIHAYAGGAKKCQEHLIDEKWQRRLVSCFSFPGIGD